MIRVIDHQGNGYGVQAEITRRKGVNGEKSLTGIIYTNEEVLHGVDRGWKLEFENERYAFTFALPKDTGNRIELEFDAVHEFFYDMSKSSQNGLLNDGSHTFRAYLDFIFRDTPYSYSLEVDVRAFEKQSFGQKNRLDLFYDIIDTAGVEFSVNGSVIRIVERVGDDLSTVVKKGFNLNELRLEKNIGDFVTYQKGFGAWYDEEDHSQGRLEVEYLSPLADIYGKLDADPIVDERYSVRDNLYARLRNNVEGSYQISVQIDMEDLTRAGYEYKQPHEGDSIMAINEDLGFQRKIRIVSYETDYDIEGNILDHRITCNSIGMVEESIYGNASLKSSVRQLQTDVELQRQQITEARVAADGKSMNYYGPIEPSPDENKLSIGDTWFDSSGEETIIKVWNGVEWRKSGADVDAIRRQIEEQQKEIESAQARADEAVSEINTAVEKAGFTSLDETISSVQTISNTADTNAQTALSQSLDALGDASLAITNAQSAIDTADGALSAANNAKSIADDASSTANTAFQNADSAIATAEGVRSVTDDLSTQVSGFETTLDGFTQVVNDYEGQVSAFRNDVQGYQSTVASYETEVDEFGNTVSTYATEVSRLENTVSGFESTVAGYRTQVLGYSEDVTRYENQVSNLNNTVQGFENTITQYTTEVDQYGNEVNRYATQVSTLNNTVNGFESTVLEVRSDFENMEIGGRNYFVKSKRPLSNTNLFYDNSRGVVIHTGVNPNMSVFYLHKLDLTLGENYIVSFEIKALNDTIQFRGAPVYVNGRIPDVPFNNPPLKEGEWVKVYTEPFNYHTAHVSPLHIYFTGFNVPGQFEMRKFKVEKGTKVTDYTPAPEDMATASQVSTLSNTVDGLNSTIARYEVELDDYGNIVSQYTTQVSQFENTVDGLSSEITTYQEDVQGYSSQVSTLQNTINGFNSTVQRVESDYADLSGTVNAHTTQISNMDGRISAKAEQSTVDTLAGTVSSLGTDIGVVAGQINQRVWNTDIETAIDGIEVGGRNYVKDSYNPDRFNFYTASGTREKVQEEQSPTGEVVKISLNGPHSGTNALYINIKSLTGEVLQKDNIYTFSFLVKADQEVQLHGNSANWMSIVDYTRETISSDYSLWRARIKPRVDAKDADNYNFHFNIRPNINEEGVVLYIQPLKVEKGNKATDWTPAPEDTLARFDHIETEWTQTFDSFSQTVSSIDGRVTQQRQDINGLTTTVQSVRTDLTGSTTLLNQTVSTVDTHTQNIATLRTDVNGKATVAQFNTLTSTVNGTITRVGNAEGKITQIETTVSGLQTTVAGKASQSQVTQLANGLSSVVTDLDDLEVGGRNLFRPNATYLNNESTTVVHKAPTSTYVDNLWRTYTENYLLDADKEFTISMWVKSRDSSGSNLTLHPVQFIDETGSKRSSSPTKDFNVSDDWQFIKWTQKSHINTVSATLYLKTGSGTVWVNGVKIEKGNKATDWTPAPEDMTTMDYTTSQISQLSDNINLRVAKNDVINQINISNENILIQSENILLDGNVTVRGTAWMDGAVIKNASMNGAKIQDATIGNAKIANLDVSKISGNLTNFVQSNWNSAIGGSVQATGNGLISTAPDSSQVVIAGGHLLARQPNGATIGSVGYVNDGTKSPNFTIETSWGTHFNIKQNFLDTWTGYTQEKDVLRVSTYDDGDSEVLWRTNRFQLLGGASLGFAWRHYINGSSQRLNITGEESIGLRANETTIFAVSNNGNTNHASLFANLNMNGSNVTNQSDARLKTDISTRQESSLEKINRFNFVDFRWLKDGRSDFGVIAQQVQQVAPELILGGEDGYLNLNNSLMNMMTSHGLQELSQKHDTVAQTVDSHTDTIHRLQQELSQANRRIEELERKIS